MRTVIALLAIGTRAVIGRRRETFAPVSRIAKPVAGGLFLFVGIAVFAGFDKWLEARLLDVAPDCYILLTTSI
jgi:ABC-type lipoprotein release transport system permease subunit